MTLWLVCIFGGCKAEPDPMPPVADACVDTPDVRGAATETRRRTVGLGEQPHANAGTSQDAEASGQSVAEPGSRPARLPQPNGCYPEMARVAGFCIDRWEAHLVTVDASGRVARHPHNERPVPGAFYQARSDPGVFPQGYVNRDEAGAACQQADKRLCTYREWRAACQAGTTRHYPYGRTFEPRRCNVGKEHLVRKLYGDDVTQWGYESHFNNPRLNTRPGFLAKTGHYERCVTEEGIYDLSGNLQEWVSAQATYPFVRRLLRDHVEREDQPMEVGNGVFVGGFFSTLREHGPGCLYTTVAHGPTYHDYSTGFRCCANLTTSGPDHPLTSAGPPTRKTQDAAP